MLINEFQAGIQSVSQNMTAAFWTYFLHFGNICVCLFGPYLTDVTGSFSHLSSKSPRGIVSGPASWRATTRRSIPQAGSPSPTAYYDGHRQALQDVSAAGHGSTLQAGVAEEVLVPAVLPTLNEMWCHVCRWYTVQSSRTSAFIIGSKQFRSTIKLHSQSNLHKVPQKLYKLHAPERQEMCRNMTLLFNTAYHLALEGRPYLDFRRWPGLLRVELKVVDQYMNRRLPDPHPSHRRALTPKTWWSASAGSPCLSIILDGQRR